MGDQTRQFDTTGNATVQRRVLRDEAGVSAVEFALLAPMLVFAVLAMVDLGMALSERMTIGLVLRAGAQVATNNVGVVAITQAVRATAAQKMQLAAVGASGNDTLLALTVSRFCTCAGAPSLEVVCSTTCTANAPTQIFYALSGQKTYAGLILPRFSLTKSLQVQVR